MPQRIRSLRIAALKNEHYLIVRDGVVEKKLELELEKINQQERTVGDRLGVKVTNNKTVGLIKEA